MLLAALTLAVAIEHGPDILTVGSLLVLGMFGFGIVGALRNPPRVAMAQFLDMDTSRARRLAKDAERRRRTQRRLWLLATCLSALLVVGVLAAKAGDGDAPPADPAQLGRPDPQQVPPRTTQQDALGPLPAEVDLSDETDAFTIPFKKPPRAGIVVNADTGEVLWRRNPERQLPIASLTKMMTALVAAEELEPEDTAKITPAVLHYTGSGVGVLPKGRRIRVETLLWGLMLPVRQRRGAGAGLPQRGEHRRARAEDERAGDQARPALHALRRRRGAEPRQPVVPRRPRRARQARAGRAAARADRARAGGRSCPSPSRAASSSSTTTTRSCARATAGILGIKTGWTDEAGRCLVAAARRGGTTLISVVLNSKDPGEQTRKLLDRGFATLR